MTIEEQQLKKFREKFVETHGKTNKPVIIRYSEGVELIEAFIRESMQAQRQQDIEAFRDIIGENEPVNYEEPANAVRNWHRNQLRQKLIAFKLKPYGE